MTKNPKRPRDPNQLAKLITNIATGEEDNDKLEEKDPDAVAMGKKGGKARASALTDKKRKEIAEKAAKARWDSDTDSHKN